MAITLKKKKKKKETVSKNWNLQDFFKFYKFYNTDFKSR